MAPLPLRFDYSLIADEYALGIQQGVLIANAPDPRAPVVQTTLPSYSTPPPQPPLTAPYVKDTTQFKDQEVPAGVKWIPTIIKVNDAIFGHLDFSSPFRFKPHLSSFLPVFWLEASLGDRSQEAQVKPLVEQIEYDPDFLSKLDMHRAAAIS